MAIIKKNLRIEQYGGLVIPEAYCRIIGISWRANEEFLFNVEMMCYWSREDRINEKMGFLKSYKIPLSIPNQNTTSNNDELTQVKESIYQDMRGLLYQVIRNSDSDFIDAVNDV